ncbi:YecH family protein [bacterium]|nr:YecH family protein [bacterium]
MAKHIHGGEVKQMAMASGKTHTRESLHKEIIDTFGKETRFFSCSAENMTADELISFFEANGKLNPSDYSFESCQCHEH